jgi:hypothetical protein
MTRWKSGPSLAAWIVLCGLFLPGPAEAQQVGALAIGGSVAVVTAPDEDVRGLTRIGPLIRYGESADGWGARIGFNWYAADLDEPIAGSVERFGRLRVRPVMGGYGYTKVAGPFALSANMLVGYAFTSFAIEPVFRDEYVRSLGVDRVRTDVSNAWVAKPEVSAWIDLNQKIGLNVSLGYLVARPTITLETIAGREERGIDADVIMLKIGVVYSVF